jgi:RimJ/RimL family protein N-acetyltransferase
MNSTNNTFLVGHTIELRVPSEDDIQNSNWHSWYNDVGTTSHNSHGVYPISVQQEAEIIQNNMNRNDSIVCSVYDLNTKKLVGNTALQNIDLIHRRCNIAITIGEQTSFSAAVEAYGLLCAHAFMRLNLERISDATHENLKKLVTMLSVIGFQEEGIREKWFFRDDKWYSKINFGILREDFLSLQSLRSGKILFENKKELDRAIIEAVKASK